MLNQTTIVHDTEEYLKTNNHIVLQHGYMFTYADKIYCSNLYDKNVTRLCEHGIGEKYNEHLAGDIENEFKVVDPYAISMTKGELKKHLGVMLNQKINSIDIKDDLWVNIQKKYEYNPTHIHEGIFSFVIYAKVPEELRQEHINSYGTRAKTRGLIQFTSTKTSDTMLLNPAKYNIYIFTSDHNHQVYPFYGDYERISIAGNIYGWA